VESSVTPNDDQCMQYNYEEKVKQEGSTDIDWRREQISKLPSNCDPYTSSSGEQPSAAVSVAAPSSATCTSILQQSEPPSARFNYQPHPTSNHVGSTPPLFPSSSISALPPKPPDEAKCVKSLPLSETTTNDIGVVKMESSAADGLTLCRLCACSRPVAGCVNMFDQPGVGMRLEEKIIKCFPVFATADDQLPNSVCLTCVEKVELCHNFVQQMFQAHRTLIQQLICDLSDPNFEQVLGSYFDDLSAFSDRYRTVKSEVPSYDENDADEEAADYFLAGNYEDDDMDEEYDGDKREVKKEKGGKRRPKKRGRRACANTEIRKQQKPKEKKRKSAERPKMKLKMRFTPSLTTCANCGHKSDSSKENFEHWGSVHKDLMIEYRCFEDDCEYRTNCIMSMKHHTKEHMFKEGKLTQCEICAKYFAKRQIKAHLAIHSDHYQYSCNKCGKMFKVRNALVTHEKIHDPEYTQNTYCCPECGKEYSMKHQFDAHVRRHTEVRPYRCEICSKAFWSPNDLQYHMSIHTGHRPYPCSKCDLKFARPLDVKKHFLTRHTEPNKFACSVCPVKYNRKDQLRVHELSHTGETPFKCLECGKGFTRKDKLVRHSDVHITDDSKYRFSCHLCEKRYTQSGSLFTHMKNSHGV